MARTQDMKALRQRLLDQGFAVERTRNGHYKVIAPDGRKVQIAHSPTCNRSVLNAVTRLKRIGFDQAA